MALKEAPGIIPALDMPLGKAIVYIDILSGLENEITGLKMGSEVIDECGLLTTDCLLKHIGNQYKVILDLQKRGTDVPDFIKRQVDLASKYAVYSYIGSPLGAGSSSDPEKPGSLQMFISSCKGCEIEPIVVLEMTQPGANYFIRDGACEELAKLSKGLGVKYFVAPATRPERIKIYRNIIGDEGEIISPGVGPQKTGDVTKDAVGAIEAGADHLVIGRGLYRADDPIDTTKRIFEAIYEAREKR